MVDDITEYKTYQESESSIIAGGRRIKRKRSISSRETSLEPDDDDIPSKATLYQRKQGNSSSTVLTNPVLNI